MDLHILPILTFLSFALVNCQAGLPPEVYWKKMLPNAEMPKAVKLSLPEWMEDKSTLLNRVHFNGKGRALRYVRHHPHPRQHGGDTDVNVGPLDGVGVHTRKDVEDGGGKTDVDVGPVNGVVVHSNKPGKGHADVDVGWGGVKVNAGKDKNKPVYVGVTPSLNPFDYRYSHPKEEQSQQEQEQGRSLFFLEDDMKFGQSMNLHFMQRTNEATFLPREKANSLPFSPSKILSILREFSVEPNTKEAKVIEETITGCKEKGIEGEQKYCATSLESLVDYAKSVLGRNVKAMSTEANIIEGNNVQNYTIAGLTKVAGDDEAAVCHKQMYAYAVFYCHKTKGTSAYMVSLRSTNGSKLKAMSVCHKDTSAWNPKHLAFQVLNVKPGSAPICHFLPEDHIVWVSN